MATSERQRVRLGGLWSRKAKSGSDVLSGRVTPAKLQDAVIEAFGWNAERLEIVAFQNTYKDGADDPDYVLFLQPAQPRAAQESA